jgi:hypothetical protein
VSMSREAMLTRITIGWRLSTATSTMLTRTKWPQVYVAAVESESALEAEYKCTHVCKQVRYREFFCGPDR